MSPDRKQGGARPESEDLIDIFVDEVPSTALRILLRDHMLWLFVGAGIAAVGFILPSESWVGVLRVLLIAAGLLFGGIRLMQANGIIQELRRREKGGKAAVRDEHLERFDA